MLENNTLLLLDGNALMHRAYHGVNKNFLPVWNNMPVGMVYGFASTLINAVNFFHPDCFIITFDTKEKTFRHEIDENYKAHRSKAPDDFYPQLPLIDELLENWKLPVLKKPGFESDDLIGTLALAGQKDFAKVLILSGDLDFTQLVNDKIKLVKFSGNLENSPIYGSEEVKARYGLEPKQMVDFKAIAGDSSDNYKGIAGIGEKGAEKLLTEFGTLENVLQNIENLAPKIREKFEKQKEYVLHCQYLAQIKTDVPLEYDFSRKFAFSENSTMAFFEKMNFPALQNRYQKLLRNYDNLGNPKPVAKKKNTDNQISLF